MFRIKKERFLEMCLDKKNYVLRHNTKYYHFLLEVVKHSNYTTIIFYCIYEAAESTNYNYYTTFSFTHTMMAENVASLIYSYYSFIYSKTKGWFFVA